MRMDQFSWEMMFVTSRLLVLQPDSVNALCHVRKRNPEIFAGPAVLLQIQGSTAAQMAGDPGQEAAELLCLHRHLQYLGSLAPGTSARAGLTESRTQKAGRDASF